MDKKEELMKKNKEFLSAFNKEDFVDTAPRVDARWYVEQGNCIICNKLFDRPRKSGAPQKFCSDECRAAYRKQKQLERYHKNKKYIEFEEATCPVCGKQFIPTGRSYKTICCSDECTRIRRLENSRTYQQRKRDEAHGKDDNQRLNN